MIEENLMAPPQPEGEKPRKRGTKRQYSEEERLTMEARMALLREEKARKKIKRQENADDNYRRLDDILQSQEDIQERLSELSSRLHPSPVPTVVAEVPAPISVQSASPPSSDLQYKKKKKTAKKTETEGESSSGGWLSTAKRHLIGEDFGWNAAGYLAKFIGGLGITFTATQLIRYAGGNQSASKPPPPHPPQVLAQADNVVFV